MIESIIGHIFGGGVQTSRVIRRMCKVCLLTTAPLYAILGPDSTGAAPADRQPAPKAGWWGDPKRPATLWTVTYRLGPSFRGLRRPEVREKLRFCSVHRRLDRSRECEKSGWKKQPLALSLVFFVFGAITPFKPNRIHPMKRKATAEGGCATRASIAPKFIPRRRGPVLRSTIFR
jgi:hypothetical protein